MKVTHPYDVIHRPILSEESTIQTQSKNKYIFEVSPKANKRQIKWAIEKQFDVQVLAVNTMNYMGKIRRNRYGAGRKASWKKAVITLRQGDSIDLI